MKDVGPSGIFFADGELLVMWATLTLNANSENAEARAKIKYYLENYAGVDVTLVTANKPQPVKG